MRGKSTDTRVHTRVRTQELTFTVGELLELGSVQGLGGEAAAVGLRVYCLWHSGQFYVDSTADDQEALFAVTLTWEEEDA